MPEVLLLPLALPLAPLAVPDPFVVPEPLAVPLPPTLLPLPDDAYGM
jgi:hypothetical protein